MLPVPLRSLMRKSLNVICKLLPTFIRPRYQCLCDVSLQDVKLLKRTHIALVTPVLVLCFVLPLRFLHPFSFLSFSFVFFSSFVSPSVRFIQFFVLLPPHLNFIILFIRCSSCHSLFFLYFHTSFTFTSHFTSFTLPLSFLCLSTYFYLCQSLPLPLTFCLFSPLLHPSSFIPPASSLLCPSRLANTTSFKST